MAALHAAVDAGVNFIDTADVYGMGRSERLIARLKSERRENIIVATKAGRRLPSQTVGGYTSQNLETWINDSLRNLGVEALDLLQLHCPPTDLFYHPEVFGCLDDLVREGKLRYYGVSVERVEEALKAIEFPGVQTVQIIFNCFRQRPAELFFPQAEQKKVGILARVPLASGLLTGKLRRDSQFAPDDHRKFNRKGEAFDVGETFSGVDFQLGLDAVEELRSLVPQGMSMTQFALRWILSFPQVSCAIPGGRTPAQVRDNCRASELPAVSAAALRGVSDVYRERVSPSVHQRW